MEDKKRITKYIIVGCIFILIVVGIIIVNKNEKIDDNNNNQTNEVDVDSISFDIIVEIKGEVRYPALYTMPANTRVSDLINLAGGFTSNADSSNLNLATKLTDGMILIVPKKVNDEKKSLVNINKATKEELMTIPGIGEAKAQAIIDYRIQNEEFKSIEEIKKVNGISETLFNNIKEYLTI